MNHYTINKFNFIKSFKVDIKTSGPKYFLSINNIFKLKYFLLTMYI